MMKKVLSVALSVIMVLGLICVPSFAADSAAVEYTVSNVSYAGEVYDALNPAADANGYALVDGITSIPENGKKLVPSVEVSATAETTATVIFAVFTDGVLTNAFYETKAVGTTAVEFSKEITVVDNTKETYEVFVLGADGKAIAPVSNFPVAENALEYMVITYADGTSEKVFGADLTGDTVCLEVTDARRAANPSIKVVPVDNSTEVSIDIDADFWQYGAVVTFAPISGDPVVLKVLPDLVELKYVPTLSYLYAFENAGGDKAVNSGLHNVEAVTKFTGTDVTVKVPVGTTALAVKKIEIGAGTANAASIAAFEVSMNGDSATVEKTAGGKTYTFNFVWDDAQPYIYNVTTANIAKPKRTVIVRTNGKALKSSSSSSTDVTAESAEKALDSGDTLADNSANMKVKINGTALPNDGSVLVLSTGNMEAGNRDATLNSVISATGKFIKGPADPNWVTFTPSADGTLYVRATQADAMEATYDWDEVADDASWYVVSDAKLGDTAVKLYAKDFTAGTPVSIPTQAIDEDEYNYVNTKLAAAGAGKDKMYRLGELEAGSLPLRQVSEDGGITWTDVMVSGKNGPENTAFDRTSSLDGVKFGYNSWFIISFNDMPVNPDGPGEGGTTPEVPPVNPDEPDEPDEPEVPTLSYTTKLALTGAPKATKVLDTVSEANNYGDTGSVYGGVI